MLMFGREPHALLFDSSFTFDPGSYQHYLRAKLTELQDLVESNLVKASNNQKTYYDKHTKALSFDVNDKVWLSIPTAGKLQPKWEGGWRVISV